MKDIVIVGASGFAREVKWLIDRINTINLQWNFKGFIDQNVDLDGVIGTDDFLYQYSKELFVAIAIADTSLRKKLFHLYQKNEKLRFPVLIDPSVMMSKEVWIGKGSIICAGTILTVDVTIGDFCIINLNCTIGHEVILANYITLNPNVNVSGNVQIQEGVNIGTGSQILQSCRIGERTIIGAGAVVVKDMPEDCTAVGIPAKIKKDRRIR